MLLWYMMPCDVGCACDAWCACDTWHPYSIENNRGRIGGRWWAAMVLRGASPAVHRGGAGERSFLSLSQPTENCAPLISYGFTVAPEEVPTINLPWWFYRGVLVGISGSGPPPLYDHYNLLLPTVPHDIPPARLLRLSIGYDVLPNRSFIPFINQY